MVGQDVESVTMSALLGADEEAQLVRELVAAAGLLARATNDLAAIPPVSFDTDAARDALTFVPAAVTRLRARGSHDGRTQAGKALAAVEELVRGALSTNLTNALLARIPAPGGPVAEASGPTVIDLAEFYRAVTDWLIRRDPRHPAISGLKRALLPYLSQTKAYAEGAEQELESPDYPDLSGIAANVLRLDVLTWVLVTSGFPKEALEIQARTRRLARAALRRATSVMNRCSVTFALVDRVNLAGTLAEIDDLVLIFQRVRDGEREEMPQGEETFAQSLGAQVIEEFTAAMTELVRGIMDSFVAGTIDVADDNRGSEVAGMLRALGKLHQLLIGVKDKGTAAAVERMTKEIGSGFVIIGQHIARSAEKAKTDQDRTRLAQIEVIHQAFLALGDAMRTGT